MNKKAVWIIVVVGFLAAQLCTGSNAAEDCPLRVYLPREAVIEDDVIHLGQVGIIRGDDLLVAKAEGVSLGRLSIPGQQVVLDRQTILARLVCSGIGAGKVSLSGAERLAVRRREEVISGEKLIEAAESYLAANRPGGLDCLWKPSARPKDVVVPGVAEDVKLVARRVPGRSARQVHPPRQVKIKVAIVRGGREIATRQVSFGLKYKCRRAVAVTDIAAGSVISPENTKLETVIADYPSRWTREKSPYGLVAKRRFRAGSVIRADAIGPAEQPIVIKRNKNVLIRIQLPGLAVTAIGQALQDGQAGEYIKVRNTDSQRIIIAKVNEDGTLEPLF